MNAGKHWKIVAAGVLAVFTVALCATMRVSIGGVDSPLMLAETYDRRARDILETAKSPAEIERGADAARRALALSPYRNSARLRLVYADLLRNGAPSPQAVEQLGLTYDLIPLDRTVVYARVRGALEVWPYLPQEIRREAGAEALAFGRIDQRAELDGISNPQGRGVAEVWSRILNARNASKDADKR